MVISGIRPDIPIELSCPIYSEIITKCWSTDPDQRPDPDWIIMQLEKILYNEIDTLEQKSKRYDGSLWLKQVFFLFFFFIPNVMVETI